jgi:Zn-dependent alcohol dehydrogenase
MIQATAALLVSPGTIVIEDVEFEGPGSGQIAVKMAAAGLCHTTLHIRDSADGWGFPFPLLLGHEGSGVVSATGSDERDLRPGDHVAIACRVPCGVCSMCSRGDPRRCRASAASPARIRRLSDGGEVSPALGIGLFADQVVVDARAAVKMDPLVPLDVAGVFGCAVMTGVGFPVPRWQWLAAAASDCRPSRVRF